jgi:LysM repeat protein
VRGGDTLAAIAARFDVSLQSLLTANGISNPNTVFAGQVLTIPAGGAAVPGTGGPLAPDGPTANVIDATTPEPTPQLATYTVLPGDSLTRIARIFNTTVAEILAVNNIPAPNNLQRGQVIFLPPGVSNNFGTGGPVANPAQPSAQPTAAPAQPQPQPQRQQQPLTLRQYVVQPGDTLDTIATRFGTTVGVIVALNDLPNPSRLFPEDVLLLP